MNKSMIFEITLIVWEVNVENMNNHGFILAQTSPHAVAAYHWYKCTLWVYFFQPKLKRDTRGFKELHVSLDSGCLSLIHTHTSLPVLFPSQIFSAELGRICFLNPETTLLLISSLSVTREQEHEIPSFFSLQHASKLAKTEPYWWKFTLSSHSQRCKQSYQCLSLQQALFQEGWGTRVGQGCSALHSAERGSLGSLQASIRQM